MRYFTYQVPLGPKKVRGHCCEVKQLWGLAAHFALESWGVLDLVVLKTGQLTGSSLWGRAPLQYRSCSAEKQISCDCQWFWFWFWLRLYTGRVSVDSLDGLWLDTVPAELYLSFFFCSFTRLFIQCDVVTVLCWWPGQVSADKQGLNVHFHGFFSFTHVITLLYSYACYCV